MWSMPKLKLNYWDLSNWVRYVTKTRNENNLTNHIGKVYIENETELS